MKKLLTFLKNWFEKNGLIKILITIIIFFISVLLTRWNVAPNFFNWIAIISGCYLILTFLVFMIAAIVNVIKDIINRRKE